MLTGTKLMNELVDELNELKLSTMAAILDDLYHRLGFLEMDEWRVRTLFWKQKSGSACEKVGDSAAVLTVVGDGNGQAWKKVFSS